MSSAGNFPSDGHTNALPPGTRLGEFEIRRVIGVGGFGIVYLAFDHGLEREVAIKEYMPSSLASRTATLHVSLTSPNNEETFKLGLRSFVNEAKLLARFDHRSLIKVHRFWEERGTAYMVMPLLRGRTLRDARRQMSAPPEEGWLRGVLDPVLGALEVLHREDVYHRDIAPDNILIGEDGVPMLLDFGAARHVIQGRSQTLTAILKPSYAPIEQYGEAANLRQGAWTDIYALGATFHYLLTEVPPQPATVRTVSDDAAPLAATARPGVSEDFLRTVDWMLMPRPSDRPQSVAQLRDVLQGRAPVPGRKVAVPAGHWPRTESQANAAPAAPAATAAAAAPTVAADDFELTRAVPRPTSPPVTPPSPAAPLPPTRPPHPPQPPVAAPRPAAGDDSWAAAPERVPPMAAARSRPGWVHWLAGGVAVAAGGAAVLFFLQRPAPDAATPAAAASAVMPAAASAAAAVATVAPSAAAAASAPPLEGTTAAVDTANPPPSTPTSTPTNPGVGAAAVLVPPPATGSPGAARPAVTTAAPAPTPAPALARTPAAQPAPKVSVDAAALRPAPGAAAEPAARTPPARPAPQVPAPERRATTVAAPAADSPPPLRPPPEAVTRPAAVERAPVERAAAERPSSDGALSPSAGSRDPRDQCGGRMLLALHRCMVRECAKPQFYDHPECVQVRAIEDRARTRISP